MSAGDNDRALGPQVWTMRIVLLFIILGITTFLVIAVVVRPGRNVPALGPMTLVAVIFAALMLLADKFIPDKVASASRRRLARSSPPTSSAKPEPRQRGLDITVQLCRIYLTRLIIGATLLESAAFFLLIAYWIEGSIPALVASILDHMLTLALKFPTRPGLERWLNRQQELLLQERMEG